MTNNEIKTTEAELLNNYLDSIPSCDRKYFALSGVAVLARSSCPNCADDAVNAAEHSSHKHSLTAAPRRSVAPLGTSSPSCKRLPHRLCVAVKFGVCVCECGKVTALKHLPTTALPPVPRCRDFNRFFIASMVFRTAPSGTCATLCLLSASPFVLFRLSF